MQKQNLYKQKLTAFNQAWQELNNFITDNDQFISSFCQDYPLNSPFSEYAGEIDKWVKSATDYLERKNCSINQSVDFQRLIHIDWDKYDGTEIHPCCAWKGEEEILPWESIDIAENFEQVNENDPNISCWSVYLHFKDGGLDNIADFKDCDEAEHFVKFILKHFLKSVSIDVNYTVSCLIGQNVNQESLRRNIELAIKNSDNCSSVIKEFDVHNFGK